MLAINTGDSPTKRKHHLVSLYHCWAGSNCIPHSTCRHAVGQSKVSHTVSSPPSIWIQPTARWTCSIWFLLNLMVWWYLIPSHICIFVYLLLFTVYSAHSMEIYCIFRGSLWFSSWTTEFLWCFDVPPLPAFWPPRFHFPFDKNLFICFVCFISSLLHFTEWRQHTLKINHRYIRVMDPT